MKCCDTSTESQDGELGAKRHWGSGGIMENQIPNAINEDEIANVFL